MEGRSPSTSGIDLRPAEGGEELGQVGVTFDAMEATFDVQERRGGPAGDLVGLEPPAGNLGGLGAVVAHDVLDRVGGQERDVQGGRDVELVQGDKLVAGLGEAGGGGRIEREQEALQGGERFATGGFALGQAQPSPQARRLGVVALAQVCQRRGIKAGPDGIENYPGIPGLASDGDTAKVPAMTKLAEIQEAIAALPPQEQTALIKWLMEEESPEMLAAIDEADRSFAAEGGVEAEDVRRNLKKWLTG